VKPVSSETQKSGSWLGRRARVLEQEDRDLGGAALQSTQTVGLAALRRFYLWGRPDGLGTTDQDGIL